MGGPYVMMSPRAEGYVDAELILWRACAGLKKIRVFVLCLKLSLYQGN